MQANSLEFNFLIYGFLILQLLTIYLYKPILNKIINTKKTYQKKSIITIHLLITTLIIIYIIIINNKIANNETITASLKIMFLIIGILIIISLITSLSIINFKIFNKTNKTSQKSRILMLKLLKKKLIKYFLSSSIILSITSIYNYLFERLNIEITQINIKDKKLPKSFHNYKILQISDLHISKYTRESYLNKMVNHINKLNANLLIFTGDYVSHKIDFKYFKESQRALSKIKKSYKKIAILGNHDFYTNPNLIKHELQKLGFTVLNNSNTTIKINNEKIHIIGLDDIVVKKDNFPKAYKKVPKNSFKILLCHSPDFIEKAKKENINLMLSGHTHGGQIKIPLIGPPIVPSKYKSKYAEGLIKENNTQLYVNRGIGVITIPIRINCRPEISKITLKKI